MNKVIFIGNIAKDLELQQTKSGTASCKFSLAVNREFVREGDPTVDFFDCRVFGKSAENLCKFQKKGNKIMVEGALRIDKVKTGEETKYYTNILVDRVEFLSQKADKPKVEKEEDLFTETEDVKEEDLPF